MYEYRFIFYCNYETVRYMRNYFLSLFWNCFFSLFDAVFTNLFLGTLGLKPICVITYRHVPHGILHPFFYGYELLPPGSNIGWLNNRRPTRKCRWFLRGHSISNNVVYCTYFVFVSVYHSFAVRSMGCCCVGGGKFL